MASKRKTAWLRPLLRLEGDVERQTMTLLRRSALSGMGKANYALLSVKIQQSSKRRHGDIMRLKGRVTHWNVERGFGFVTPVGGGARVFLHITAISGGRRSPVDGDMVTYELAFDDKRRPRAVRVKHSLPTQPRPAPSNSFPLIITSLFLLLVIGGAAVGRLPLLVVPTYAVVSILTFLIYWFDKAAARRGQWRTKESYLLFLGLAAGWPGAVLAQRVLHHKSRKRSFQVAFWATAVMNSIALGWLLTDRGSEVLGQLLR
jgi:uncharacterized membrane protein YsdA (DUF1294 family)/cold shock CspA family protein